MSGQPPNVRQPSGESPLAVWVYPLVTIAAWVVGIALVLRFFRAFAFVFLGGLAAGALAAALKPMRDGMAGPRWLAGTVVGLIPLLAGAGMVYFIGWLIAGPVADEMKQWPVMKENLNSMLAGWSHWFGLERPVTVETLQQQLEEYLTGPGGKALAETAQTLLPTIAAALLLIFIGSLYLQAESPTRIITPILKMLPPERRGPFQRAFDDLVPRLRWWLIGSLVDMVVVGLTAWGVFTLGGLPLAIPLAILTGFSEIIPTIGPAFMFVVALLFALSQGTTTVLVVMGAFGLIHMLEGYVLQPLVMKQAVRIPPIVTLFTLVLWNEIFGFPGLLLALPINLFLWSFLDHFLLRRYERPQQWSA